MNARRLALASTCLLAAISLTACPGGDGPAPAGGQNPSSAPAPPPATGGGGDPGAEQADGDPAAGEGGGEEASGPKLAPRKFRVVVEATLEGVPEGAYVVAPSARDRAYQKVTKSEHTGIPGAVMPSEDGGNLFFVSDPIKAGAGTLTYKGTFEVDRRPGTQGDVKGIADAAYEGDAGKVTAAPSDAGIIAAAKALGEGLAPVAAVTKAVEKTRELELHPTEGVDAAAEVLGGKPGSGYGIATLTAELAKALGVPARLVQGVQSAEMPASKKASHTWIEVELPTLGWVPVDPVLRRTGGSDTGLYMGTIPADRVTLVAGASAVIPAEEGIVPRLELSGPVAHPFALKDGKRVGTVKWEARFEAL